MKDITRRIGDVWRELSSFTRVQVQRRALGAPGAGIPPPKWLETNALDLPPSNATGHATRVCCPRVPPAPLGSAVRAQRPSGVLRTLLDPMLA
jgi:hypothetical protein